jgi:hypothetical protein
VSTTNNNGARGPGPAAPARLATFHQLLDALGRADAHPGAAFVERRASHLMSRWLTERAARHPDTPPEQRLLEEIGIAEATVSEHAECEGQRARGGSGLGRGGSAVARRGSARKSAVDDALGRGTGGTAPDRGYLMLEQPNLALAWCTIATADGLPIQEVQPLMTRAWQDLRTPPRVHGCTNFVNTA